jgi:hypothetical protein
MKVVSMANPVFSKNLNFGTVRHFGFELDGEWITRVRCTPLRRRRRE